MTDVRAHAGGKIRIYGWSILQFRLGSAMDQQYEDEKQHTETMRYIDPIIRRCATRRRSKLQCKTDGGQSRPQIGYAYPRQQLSREHENLGN